MRTADVDVGLAIVREFTKHRSSKAFSLNELYAYAKERYGRNLKRILYEGSPRMNRTTDDRAMLRYVLMILHRQGRLDYKKKYVGHSRDSSEIMGIWFLV